MIHFWCSESRDCCCEEAFHVVNRLKESVLSSGFELEPAVLQWIQLRRIRWQIFKKQAVGSGLLLEILGDEIRRVVQDDHELLAEAITERSQEVLADLGGERVGRQRDEVLTSISNCTEHIDRRSPARDRQSRAGVHRKPCRFLIRRNRLRMLINNRNRVPVSLQRRPLFLNSPRQRAFSAGSAL